FVNQRQHATRNSILKSFNKHAYVQILSIGVFVIGYWLLVQRHAVWGLAIACVTSVNTFEGLVGV
ncbi:MAG: hypothetical protein KDC44_11675, partial [Phaeodactylibacter sp.]|nr:hypothetical protein [Phaeodactylibacter sp.]